jgi:hypothetical protein
MRDCLLAGTLTTPSLPYIYSGLSRSPLAVAVSVRPVTDLTVTPQVLGAGCSSVLSFDPTLLTYNSATLSYDLTLNAGSIASTLTGCSVHCARL